MTYYNPLCAPCTTASFVIFHQPDQGKEFGLSCCSCGTSPDPPLQPALLLVKSALTLDAAPNTVEQDLTLSPSVMNFSLSSDQLEDMIYQNDCRMRAFIDAEVSTLLDRRLEAVIAHMERHVKVLVDTQLTTVMQKLLLAGMGILVAPEIRGDDSPLMSNEPELSNMPDGERIIPIEQLQSRPGTFWPSEAPSKEMLDLAEDSSSVTDASWLSEVPCEGMVEESPSVSTASWTPKAASDRVVIQMNECSSWSTPLCALSAQRMGMVISTEESRFIADASVTSEAPLSSFLAPPITDTTVSTTVPPASDAPVGVRLDVHEDGSIGVRLDVHEEESLVVPNESWVSQIGVQFDVYDNSSIGVRLDVHEDDSFIIPNDSGVLRNSIPASITIATTITEVKSAASATIPQTNLLQLHKSTPLMTLSAMSHTQDMDEMPASCTRGAPTTTSSNFHIDGLTRLDTQSGRLMDKSEDSEMCAIKPPPQQNDESRALDSYSSVSPMSTTQTSTRSCLFPEKMCRDTCDMNTPIMAWRASLRKEEIQLIDAINTQLEKGANISMSWIKDRLKNILANQRYHLKAKIMRELNFGNTRDNNNMHLIDISKKMWETMDSMELQLDSMELDDDFMVYPLYNLRNSCDILDEIICKDINHMDLLNISKKMWETMDSMELQLDSMESDRDFMTCHFQDADQAWERDQHMIDKEEVNCGNNDPTPTTENIDKEDYTDGTCMGEERNSDIVDTVDDTKEVYKDANDGIVETVDDTKEVYVDVSKCTVDIDDTKELYTDVKDSIMETMDDVQELFS